MDRNPYAIIPAPSPSPLDPSKFQQRRDHDANKNGSTESLGKLLVDMTAQVQEERSRRSEVEKRNQSLLMELEQLQQEMIELKTSAFEPRYGGSTTKWGSSAARSDHGGMRLADDGGNVGDATPSREASADFWWHELQEAKKAKDKALIEAHQRAMQVMELNACISMQHDELKALRSTEHEARFALQNAEEKLKELVQQNTILVQENQLLKDDVSHLNSEIGKRGVHFKSLMEKWTEAQAQSEHLERENHAMLEKMKEIRLQHEQLVVELEKTKDERDCLQHQVNHLKGAVAAKAAESKAFQAYGTNARDHLQAQHAVIERHQIFRRKIHKIARDSIIVLKNMKSTLATVRAPLVTIQADFAVFLRNLQKPVLSLVTKSQKFAEIAHSERQPMKLALATSELTRRHLHDQLWKSKQNAMMICQVWNAATSSTEPPADAPPAPLSIKANYSTGELLLRDEGNDTIAVKLDAIYSDRAREWNHFESVAPLLQSILDGFNACVVTLDGCLPIKTSKDEVQDVPTMALQQLFQALRVHGAQFHRVRLTISYLAIYNECVYDLLGLDSAVNEDTESGNKIIVLEVQNADEAALVLQGGQENLRLAHQNCTIQMQRTHKVITVCVTHENLLTGSSSSPCKSKLQIVDLALGDDEAPVPSFHRNDEDRSRVKSLVAMENGVQALLTTLADVRTKDPAFVRYHSSKLTVLLQDTIKASAKVVAIVGVPTTPGIPVTSATGTCFCVSDERVRLSIRLLAQFQRAVRFDSPSTSPWKGGVTDRSIEGFMHRFHQSPSRQILSFSSSEIQERSRQEDQGGSRWEKELETATKRYGEDMTFYQPAPASIDPTATTDGGSETSPLSSQEKSPSDKFSSAGERSPSSNSVVIHHHPSQLEYDGATTSLVVGGNRMISRRPKSSMASKSRSHHHHAERKKTRATISSSSPTTVTTTTLATSIITQRSSHHGRSAGTGQMLRIRRETASSSLKKSLHAFATMSPSTKAHKKRIPFK